jgi:hypothetical protein
LVIAALVVASCQNKTKTPKYGSVMLISKPWKEAEVFIDGKKTGYLTDVLIKKLPAGTYKISLKKTSPNGSLSLYIGEATVKVTAGKLSRAIITLNPMDIEETPTLLNREGPASASQKLIQNFFKALQDRNYLTAYSLISKKLQKQLPYYKFRRNWGVISNVEITSFEITGVSKDERQETDTVTLQFSRKKGRQLLQETKTFLFNTAYQQAEPVKVWLIEAINPISP